MTTIASDAEDALNRNGAMRGILKNARRGAAPLTALLLLALILAGTAAAAEIVVGQADGKPGESVTVPVYAKGVENLAGVKLVLTYDPDKLTFEQADKTPLTTSLMHIVNSKKAGRLIVVMAGARGVNAEDGTILDLRFRVPEGQTDSATAEIKLQQVEVMSDKLKEVAADGVAGGVRLGGEAAEAVSKSKDGAKPEAPEVRLVPAKAAQGPTEKPAPAAEAASPSAAKADPPHPATTETDPSPDETETAKAESAEPPADSPPPESEESPAE
jgi:hypothetical protein